MVILRNFFEQRPNSVLLGCFREQDADGSGQLELAEFTRALQSLNINLSDADIAGVFAALDSDGGGILELKEFLNELKAEPDPRQARWLRLGIGHQYVEPNREPPSTLGVKNEPWLSGFNRGNRTLADGDKSIPEPKRDEAVLDIGDSGDGAETALTLLRDFFSRRSVSSLLTLFQDVDQDDSGVIDVDEFATALRQLNMHLSQEDIQGLFNYFDKDGGGECEVREILATLKAEPTAEESRWQRIGIGKQHLTATRDVHIKVPPYHPTTLPPYHPTTLLTVLPSTVLLQYHPQPHKPTTTPRTTTRFGYSTTFRLLYQPTTLLRY
jgi:Ca2+-binding EF-hand superfamily protein